MLSIQDYWMGRDRQYAADLTPQIIENAEKLVRRIDTLLGKAAAGNVAPGIDEETLTCVASGWRPPAVNNNTVNASPTSPHLQGLGIDLRDTPDRALARFCLRHTGLLAELGLWMEDPRWTPTWVHLQTKPPRSGDRVFVPSDTPPLAAALPEQQQQT